MKLLLTFLMLCLCSTFALAECEKQQDTSENMSRVLAAVNTCEVDYSEMIDLHNSAIDQQKKVAQLVDKARESSKAKSCIYLKEANELMPDTIKGFEKCWKRVKKTITSCIDYDNYADIKTAGDNCWNSIETTKKWDVAIKDALSSCK